ncbi:phospholipase D-like domain-containing protein [Lujinxingia litoralis]|nr:phospholipase D-like domain-containing protein [Lujinxingia litoralis]
MMTRGMASVARTLVLAALALAAAACGLDDPGDLETLETPSVEVFFNSPGYTRGSEFNRKPSEFITERIDAARVSVDAAVYGFNKQNIVDALVRAHYRGVRVRLVADAGEYSRGSYGYDIMEQHKVPIQTGNQFHIMHDKFFVVDNRFVFVGTGNISNSEFTRNNNNWVWFDNVEHAELYTAEFEQMFDGRFSAAKHPTTLPNVFQIGDTEVEVLFSPQDDAMGKILEELKNVESSIYFTIFAFTKDQVASEFIARHKEFERFNAENGFDDLSPLERPKGVVGVLDRSQLHGNGQYHQGYRLAANGIPMRLDGNENSRLPGDYQAGGGRLHAKTMILDAGTPNARVITGSFNWSSAATISNDEILIVLRGERITNQYLEEFHNIWRNGKDISTAMCNLMVNNDELRCDDEVQPGDVVFSEVHFDGWNGERDPSDHNCGGGSDLDCRRRVTNDQFIELYNTTDKPINLSMWTLSNGQDVTMGFTPGTVIDPGEYFLVLDHNTVPLSERDPQRGEHAFTNPDFVLNTANDPRFRRLNLKAASMQLELRNTRQVVVDRAGDGSPAYFGGRQGDTNYSMERIIDSNGSVGAGDQRGSWKQCSATEGGVNVNEAFRSFIFATPGEANSP